MTETVFWKHSFDLFIWSLCPCVVSINMELFGFIYELSFLFFPLFLLSACFCKARLSPEVADIRLFSLLVAGNV